MLCSTALMAQDDEPVIELSAKVRTVSKDNAPIQVIVFQDNEQTKTLTLDKKNSFELELALNNSYTIQVRNANCEPYSVFIDASVSTKLDSDQKMKMEVLLQPKGSSNDAYYADFPNAIMSWDAQTGVFMERQHYSAHIMEKKQLLQASAVE